MRLTIIAIIALALSACDDPMQMNPPAEPETVVVDEECPRADGEPCR